MGPVTNPVIRYVRLLVVTVVASAVITLALFQAQREYGEVLQRTELQVHHEAIRVLRGLEQDLDTVDAGLATPGYPPDAAADLYDRAVPVITAAVQRIAKLPRDADVFGEIRLRERMMREADRLLSLGGIWPEPDAFNIGELRRAIRILDIRVSQLARWHEHESEQVRHTLDVLEAREVPVLLLLLIASLIPTTLVARRIMQGIRKVLADQQNAEQRVRESASLLRQTLDNMSAFVGRFGLDGTVLDANRTALLASNAALSDLVGRPAWSTPLLAGTPEGIETFRSAFARAASGTSVQTEITVTAHDQLVTLDATFSPVLDEHGGIQGVLGFGVDVTARKRAEGYMRTLSTALEQTADSVMITGTNGVIEYVNEAFVQTTGYGAYEAIGRTPNLLKSGKHPPEFYKALWDTILAGRTFSQILVNRRKDGTLYSEEKQITPLRDTAGRITHFVSTGRDITERIQAQERMHFLANHDALTGLPNRMLFVDRLQQALARARWNKRVVAAVFVDLDRFKDINDTLGHNTGDSLLATIASRLSSIVREGDTVARFGGDEFVMLLDNVAAAEDVAMVADKILAAVESPVESGTAQLHVGASIGISLFPADGDDPETLLKHADAAMYRAKESGRNNYQFYSREMSTRAFERVTLEGRLRQALDRHEFTLHYQPQVDVLRGRVVGLEALLRWRNQQIGDVSPGQFIPVLEDTGLIVPVGEWVLTEACAQLARWRAAGLPTVRVSVNVSSRQFLQPNLASVVSSAIARAGIPPVRLELEITESLLMHPTGATRRAIAALDELGVRFGLDDFGTGYSSLNYLRQYPFDTLKVDRSFVRGLPDAADHAALARAILAMGHSLQLDVIAEGVETAPQRDFLLSYGCVTMQGFLFARPMPAHEIGPWIADRSRGLGEAHAA